jgi:hypothetical protein
MRPRTPVLAAALGLALAAWSPARSAPRHPGLIDLQAFKELAGADDEITEINLGRELLGALATGMEDPAAARLLEGIVSVRAVVIGLADADQGRPMAERVRGARELVEGTTSRLLKDGWEALVRVREKTSSVSVLTLASSAQGKIDGLAVLVVDLGDGDSGKAEIVFANIAGTLDMAQMRRLSNGLELPGLDRLGEGPKP